MKLFTNFYHMLYDYTILLVYFSKILPICCQFIFTHVIFTSFGRFILTFNKTALILLGVPIVSNLSSFEFHQVKLP